MAPSPYIFIISIGPVDMNKYARFDEIPSRTLKDIKETKRYGRTDRRTDMNKYARFDEIPSRTLKDIKETKRYGRTDRRTDGRTDNVKTVYPPTNTVCGGYKNKTMVYLI